MSAKNHIANSRVQVFLLARNPSKKGDQKRYHLLSSRISQKSGQSCYL